MILRKKQRVPFKNEGYCSIALYLKARSGEIILKEKGRKGWKRRWKLRSKREVWSFLSSFPDLENSPTFGISRQELSLEPMYELMKRFPSVKGSTRFIHITGSKGKGSMAFFLEALLLAQGLRVGLFTSPHLIDFRERIRFQGLPISELEWAEAVEALPVEVGEPFSLFELSTAIAFDFFARKQADWAIIEVGMGGRVDATNILHPDLCILTEMALEHQKQLGETLPEILKEKLGILKEKVPLLSFPRHAELQEELAQRVALKNCPWIHYGRDFQVNIHKSLRKRTAFSCRYGEQEYQGEVPYSSVHQAVYAAGAWVATQILKLPSFSLPLVQIPGREEWWEIRPCFLFDVAHEESSLAVLWRIIQENRGDFRQVFVIFGAFQDKKNHSFLEELFRESFSVFLCPLPHPRSWKPEERYLEGDPQLRIQIQTIEEACLQVQKRASPEDLIVVTGSFKMVAEVQKWMDLKGKIGK
jgi:dihydrofolate synthase/folylpolyglutamate synthase